MTWAPRTSEQVRRGQAPVPSETRVASVYDLDGVTHALNYVERPPDPIDQPSPYQGKPWGAARRFITFFFDPFKTDNGREKWHFGLPTERGTMTKVPQENLADPLTGYMRPFRLRMNITRPEPITVQELWDQSQGYGVPGTEGTILP